MSKASILLGTSILGTVNHVIASSQFHSNFSYSYTSNATSNEHDVSPLYNGLAPPDTYPLALGFYATPEVIEPIPLEIEGHFPRWITGSLYRGAQGTWDSGNYTSEHWFDGFSRQHRFEIEDGKVFYRSRNGSDEVQDCELPSYKADARSDLNKLFERQVSTQEVALGGILARLSSALSRSTFVTAAATKAIMTEPALQWAISRTSLALLVTRRISVLWPA